MKHAWLRSGTSRDGSIETIAGSNSHVCARPPSSSSSFRYECARVNVNVNGGMEESLTRIDRWSLIDRTGPSEQRGIIGTREGRISCFSLI